MKNKDKNDYQEKFEFAVSEWVNLMLALIRHKRETDKNEINKDKEKYNE